MKSISIPGLAPMRLKGEKSSKIIIDSVEYIAIYRHITSLMLINSRDFYIKDLVSK